MAHIDSSTARVIGATEEIAALLEQQRVSQRELARRLGVSQPWVRERLIGETSISVGDIEAIAAALGVPVTQFLPTAEPAPGGAR